MGLALALIVGLAVVVGIMFLTIYNSLVRMRTQVRNAWAQIDVQLKRRHDLIPNLVETAKGYMAHEKETLENITGRQPGFSVPTHLVEVFIHQGFELHRDIPEIACRKRRSPEGTVGEAVSIQRPTCAYVEYLTRQCDSQPHALEIIHAPFISVCGIEKIRQGLVVQNVVAE